MDYIYNYIMELIKEAYNKKTIKIAELGIGYYYGVAKLLNNHNDIDLIVVDMNKDAINKANKQGLNGVVDNIFNPSDNIYKDIDIIYSIRPPRDLQPYILNICKKNNCKLIIKPLSGEQPIDSLKLVNYKGAPLYI